MTIASFLSRRRRILVVCAASVLLHYVAIGWVGARIGPGLADSSEAAPEPIMAALLAPPAPPPAAPAPAAKAPRPAPAPPAGEETPPAPPAPPVVEGGEAALVAAPATPVEEDVVEEAVAEPPAEAPATAQAPAEAVPEAPPAAAEPAPAPPPGYRVSLPPSAHLSFELTRKDAKGTDWNGVADMRWRQRGDSYRLVVDGFVNMLVTRVAVLRISSEGAIGPHGIAPRRATEKRLGRAQTATHFDAAAERISFSASEQTFPLTAGAQDKLSVQWQLAGIARADSAQLAQGVEIMVGSERDVAPYRFVVEGQEEIETPMGRIPTWHLSRPPRPGSYNARLDIWLAPQHEWYPVKVRSTESSGAVTTQTIREIRAIADHAAESKEAESL